MGARMAETSRSTAGPYCLRARRSFKAHFVPGSKLFSESVKSLSNVCARFGGRLKKGHSKSPGKFRTLGSRHFTFRGTNICFAGAEDGHCMRLERNERIKPRAHG